MLFEDNWCTVEKLSDCTNIKINATTADINQMLSMTENDIKYRATKSVIDVVGNNPVLCLSGGVDSQAMINLWHSDFPYTAITFEFAGGLNSHEVNDAREFAALMNIPFKTIKLDIMRFLTRDLLEFSKKHGMSSPQFSVLAYFIDHLKGLGYSGAVLGGDVFSAYIDIIKFGLTTAQLTDIYNYSQVSKFPVVPSFLSFNKMMCLFVASRQSVATVDDIYVPPEGLITSGNMHVKTTLRKFTPVDSDRAYIKKVGYYQNLDMILHPQQGKRTGFEQVKDYYNTLNNNQWAFERDFRAPLYAVNPNNDTATLTDTEFTGYMIEVMKKYSCQNACINI